MESRPLEAEQLATMVRKTSDSLRPNGHQSRKLIELLIDLPKIDEPLLRRAMAIATETRHDVTSDNNAVRSWI